MIYICSQFGFEHKIACDKDGCNKTIRQNWRPSFCEDCSGNNYISYILCPRCAVMRDLSESEQSSGN